MERELSELHLPNLSSKQSTKKRLLIHMLSGFLFSVLVLIYFGFSILFVFFSAC